jgi:hypothetical protein
MKDSFMITLAEFNKMLFLIRGCISFTGNIVNKNVNANHAFCKYKINHLWFISRRFVQAVASGDRQASRKPSRVGYTRRDYNADNLHRYWFIPLVYSFLTE